MNIPKIHKNVLFGASARISHFWEVRKLSLDGNEPGHTFFFLWFLHGVLPWGSKHWRASCEWYQLGTKGKIDSHFEYILLTHKDHPAVMIVIWIFECSHVTRRLFHPTVFKTVLLSMISEACVHHWKLCLITDLFSSWMPLLRTQSLFSLKSHMAMCWESLGSRSRQCCADMFSPVNFYPLWLLVSTSVTREFCLLPGVPVGIAKMMEVMSFWHWSVCRRHPIMVDISTAIIW